MTRTRAAIAAVLISAAVIAFFLAMALRPKWRG